MEGDENKPVEETEKEEIIVEEEQSEESEEEAEDQSEESPDADEPEEPDAIVLIGDEEPEQKEEAPQWVKDVRKRNRELEKENKKLRKQAESSVQKIGDPGKKPSLEDFDYDAEKYEAAYDNWKEKKDEYESSIKTQEDQEKQEEEEFQKKMTSYQKQKLELPFKTDEIEEAEQIVRDILTPNQIGSIVKYRDNSALVFVAIGKNPKKAKELSEIKDPIKFAIEMADLEKNLKIKQRKPANAPEKTVSGSGPTMTAGDKELNRLRVEAEKTGDYTKIREYKEKLKAK